MGGVRPTPLSRAIPDDAMSARTAQRMLLKFASYRIAVPGGAPRALPVSGMYYVLLGIRIASTYSYMAVPVSAKPRR